MGLAPPKIVHVIMRMRGGDTVNLEPSPCGASGMSTAATAYTESKKRSQQRSLNGWCKKRREQGIPEESESDGTVSTERSTSTEQTQSTEPEVGESSDSCMFIRT